MSNVKISELPAVTTVVSETDVLPLVSNSGTTTTKATPKAITAASNAATTAGTNPALFGAATSANATRFPNAQAVISNTAAGIQQNESHNIGLMAEGTANAADTNIYGVGVYGAGYTNGATRCGGVIGEGHVSVSADTGASIGVRGYATQTHSGGNNVGLYGNASGGANNYALWMAGGNINSTTAQAWSLGGNLTFSGGNIITPGLAFPASSTLTDYEYGTWVPVDLSGAGLTITVNNATYTKIGTRVFVNCDVTYPVTANASSAKISLPYTASKYDLGTAMALNGTVAGVITIGNVNATTFRSVSIGTLTNANLSGTEVIFSLSYTV